MARLARLLLRLMPLAFPAVFAACYGPAAGVYNPTVTGKVVDKVSSSPIQGIQVSCSVLVVSSDAGPLIRAHGLAGADGAFTLPDCLDADTLLAEDVDGAANGSYQTVSVKMNGTSGNTIAMAKQ